MAYNRELSQFASLVEVSNTSKRIGIITDLNVSGIITATRFYGSGRFLTDVIAVTNPGGGDKQIQFNNSSVTDGASQFFYNSTSNNVGIATSNPTSKLHVLGNALVTGILTAGIGSFTSLNSTNLNISGVSTITNLTVTTLNYSTSGVTTIPNARITDLYITGISTFINGPILVGTASSTGVSAQRLQVTGKAYISDNLGVGEVNPSSRLYVNGDTYVTGVVTATSAIVGSAVTINSTGVRVGTTITINSSGINVSGVITATDFNSLSDVNYKKNINTVNGALLKVEQMRGVKFDWKESGLPSYGVIAQELQEILPELVHGGDPKTVNYNGIIGVLIEAIKELKEEINDLKDQINK